MTERLGTQEALRPAFTAERVQGIAGALLGALHDESWPVRDVACGAAGALVKTFPCAEAPSWVHSFEERRQNR